MNEVIRQIQAQRDDCVSELWSPEANLTGATLSMPTVAGQRHDVPTSTPGDRWTTK